MNYITLAFLFSLPFVLFSQKNSVSTALKGAAPIKKESQTEKQGVTYAVVIGISDYQDPAIPDLRFADKDAEAFAHFLRSDAGGKLDDDHLKVLINSKATMAQFAIQLDWLMENAKENDRVFIYFSGHGDVEKKTLTQPGFLLCWDAPAHVYMSGGAFALPMLQEVISTLSIQSKAKVIVITDACRSGKLSGSSINGNQLTNSNLAKQYANEIKILSCQPNEYSLEGTQWGGGRGVFSYHLINALYGLADNNFDNMVSLKEVSRYLEDEVSKEVSPQSQNPMVIGSVTEKLSDVNPGLLASLKNGQKDQTQIFSAVESRGMEDELLASIDSNIVKVYRAFQKALKDKQFLMAEKGRYKNDYADYYYTKLMAEPQLQRLHSTLRRNYAAALQDDAQQVMNKWMKTGEDEALLSESTGKSNRLPVKIFNEKLKAFPSCLNRAAELLGIGHYMYTSLKARSHFFEGYLLANSNRNPNVKLGEKALKEFQLALQLQANLPQAYWQMSGVYCFNLLQPDSAELYAKKAMKLQPTWLIPYVDIAFFLLYKYNLFDRAKSYIDQAVQIDSNSFDVCNLLGVYYMKKREYVEAEKYYLRALNLDSTSSFAYNNLGITYVNTQQLKEAEKYYLKAIKLDSTNSLIYYNFGNLYSNTQQFKEAEKYYLKALDLDSTYISAYNNLGNLYTSTQRLKEAEKYFLKVIDLDSTSPLAYNNMGNHYNDTHRYSEAEKYYLKALALDSTMTIANVNLGITYALTSRYKEAEKYFLKAINIDSSFSNAYYNLACILSLQNKAEEAYMQLELAIQKGNYKYEEFEKDTDLQNIRSNKDRWNALMKKYYLDQFKDK